MSFEGSERLFRVKEAILVDAEVTDHFKAQNLPIFNEPVSLQSRGCLWDVVSIFGPKWTAVIEGEVAKRILRKCGK